MNDFRSPAAIDWQGDVGTVSFGDDGKLVVWFFRKSVLLGKASEEAGRPVHEGRDYVHIQQPGERDYAEREATELDRHRFAKKWELYLAGREQTADGTPLETIFPNDPDLIDTMRPLKIRTVEQLAGLTEAAIGRLGMGGRANVEKAKLFLEQSKAAVPFHKLKSELTTANEQIETLKTQVAALMAQQKSKKGAE